MASTNTPCDGLSLEDRANRLSYHMIVLGEAVCLKTAFVNKARPPGFCSVCGHRLPVTWRAVRCDEPASEDHPTGKFSVAEASHDSASLATMEQWKKDHPEGAWGLRDGFWLAPVTSCASLDARTFTAAMAIAARRHWEANRPDEPATGASERKQRSRAALNSF